MNMDNLLPGDIVKSKYGSDLGIVLEVRYDRTFMLNEALLYMDGTTFYDQIMFLEKIEE